MELAFGLNYRRLIDDTDVVLGLQNCYNRFNVIKKKVKGSCNRPGVAQRVPGVLGSQISMTFGT
jgi:hypothetical protein